MFIMDSVSEGSTHDSSFESQTKPHLRDNIESAIALMQRVVLPRLKLGIEQVNCNLFQLIHHYLDQAPERIGKVIQQA